MPLSPELAPAPTSSRRGHLAPLEYKKPLAATAGGAYSAALDPLAGG